jgi:mannosyl-3-phosphoglycerate phosphatase
MNANPPVVVVCDVDGVLLDPATALFDQAAATTLDRLAGEEIPVVLCSGRTRAELERFQQDCGLEHPFICENGAALFIPANYFSFDIAWARAVAGYQVVEFGPPYHAIVETLRRTADRQRVDIVGFNDLSVEEVAAECALPLMQARLAKLREYGELFRLLAFDGAARARLFRGLRAARLGCTPGDRYNHVGAPVDKGVGVDIVCSLYRRAFGSVMIAGFGQTLEDVPLLRSVDLPLVLHSGDRAVTAEILARVPDARLVSAGGAGWTEGVLHVLRNRLPIRQVDRTATTL